MKPFAEGKDYGLVQGYRAIRHTEKPKLEGLPMGRACHVHGDNAVCHGCCRGQGPQDVRLHARKVFRRVPLPCVVEGLEKAWHAAVEVLAGKSKPTLGTEMMASASRAVCEIRILDPQARGTTRPGPMGSTAIPKSASALSSPIALATPDAVPKPGLSATFTFEPLSLSQAQSAATTPGSVQARGRARKRFGFTRMLCPQRLRPSKSPALSSMSGRTSLTIP